jgi:hypothetical protein
MPEAGVRQFGEWGNCDQGRHILIAVSRYLAAHFPTQRALLRYGVRCMLAVVLAVGLSVRILNTPSAAQRRRLRA